MAQKDIGNKRPLHTLENSEEVRDFYDDWSLDNQYNIDMLDWNYTGPKESVDNLKRFAPDRDILIFDAGCGSGLVGAELTAAGYRNLHGADLSKKLLERVPAGLYQQLQQLDLNRPLGIANRTYDALMCVGTFTYGHVAAHALDEFVRITKPAGLICFTINEGIYESQGFDAKIRQLEACGAWQKEAFFKSEYLASKEVNAWLGLYRVIDHQRLLD